MKRFYKLLLCFLLCFTTLSCNKAYIDEDTKTTRQASLDDLVRVPSLKTSNTMPLISDSNVPTISKLLVAPPPPPMGNGKLISFSVTEEVPLKDVLIELGRVADVDIEVDPNIKGGIILKTTNKPLNVIVERISELASLRYTYQDGILKFRRDIPYTKTYEVDFLVDNDIWGSVEGNLTEIIELYKPNIVSDDGGDVIPDPKIISNKQAGMITIYANGRTHTAIDSYMIDIKRNYSAQVLIEAKVVEVKLNKEFQMGIDWNFLNNSGSRTLDLVSGISIPAAGVSGSLKTAVFGGDLTATINAMDRFGLARTISSPRVHAINNQESALKFTNKLIYFSLEKEEETDSNTGITKDTYTSTKQEEETGVTLTITPSINLVKNEITMKVTPELKVKIGEVADPTNSLNVVPIIQTRSVETSLKINSGSILVIGGLMTEDNSNTDTGIPFLSGIPILGYLFKGADRSKEVIETVIFIKATIVKPDGQIRGRDLELYQKYGDGKGDFYN